jgi:DNA-binding CsgD family transcriptional regulator
MLYYVQQNKMIGGLVMSNEENFVFYADWINVIKAYDDSGQQELAGELAKQIIYYGVTGEITSTNPIIIGLVNSMCAALIEKSKNRYQACIRNGQRGGRPKQYNAEEIIALRNSGLTHQQIADRLGCSKKTVQRALGDDEDEI